MCQIALSKSTEKLNLFFTAVTVARTIMQSLHKKILQLLFFYFLSTFGKRNLTHLTTDVLFSGQRFAILAMFRIDIHERSGAQLSINYVFLSNFARPDNLTVPVACAGLQVKLSKGN